MTGENSNEIINRLIQVSHRATVKGKEEIADQIRLLFLF